MRREEPSGSAVLAALTRKCVCDEVVGTHGEVSEGASRRPSAGSSAVLAELKKGREWGLPGLEVSNRLAGGADLRLEPRPGWSTPSPPACRVLTPPSTFFAASPSFSATLGLTQP